MGKHSFQMTTETLAKLAKENPDAHAAVIASSPEAAATWEDSARARRVESLIGVCNEAATSLVKANKLESGDVGYVGVNVDREPPFYLKSRQTGEDDRMVVNDGDLKRDGVSGFTDGKNTVAAKTGELLDAVGIDHYRGKRYQNAAKRDGGIRKCDGTCASTKNEKPHAHGDQSSRRVNESDAVAALAQWEVTFTDAARKSEPVNGYFAAIRHAPASR